MQVYLDNAATTPLHPAVIEVMHQVMTKDYGNPSSIHAHGRKARTLIEDARKSVAEILKASTGEIFFTSCATESNNMALKRSVIDLGVQRIISSKTEHPCVLNTLAEIKEEYPAVEITYLDVDGYGNIDYSQLDSLLSSGQKTLVSLMHGNNEIGTVLDLQQASDICATHDALLHSDTVQTIGKLDIDLSQTKLSFLSGSGHKIYGPKGIGIIYINNDNMIKSMIRGGGQERDLRSGTENLYGIVGFAKALELLYHEREVHNQKTEALRQYFKTEAAKHIPVVQYNGNQDERYLPHILNISLPKTIKTDLIMFNLDISGICASAGSACSSGAERDSHVHEAIQSDPDRKNIRFSFSSQNTTDEIDYVISKLKDLID